MMCVCVVGFLCLVFDVKKFVIYILLATHT